MKLSGVSSRIWPTLIWVAFAGFAAAVAWRFPSGNGVAPGPAAVPLSLAAVLAGLGCLLLFASRKPATGTPTPSGSPGRTIALVGLMVAYVALMPWLGFISSSALLVMAVLRLLDYRHGARAAALGLVAGFALHGFFAGLMGVPLPQGWLG